MIRCMFHVHVHVHSWIEGAQQPQSPQLDQVKANLEVFRIFVQPLLAM